MIVDVMVLGSWIVYVCACVCVCVRGNGNRGDGRKRMRYEERRVGMTQACVIGGKTGSCLCCGKNFSVMDEHIAQTQQGRSVSDEGGIEMIRLSVDGGNVDQWGREIGCRICMHTYIHTGSSKPQLNDDQTTEKFG